MCVWNEKSLHLLGLVRGDTDQERLFYVWRKQGTFSTVIPIVGFVSLWNIRFYVHAQYLNQRWAQQYYSFFCPETSWSPAADAILCKLKMAATYVHVFENNTKNIQNFVFPNEAKNSIGNFYTRMEHSHYKIIQYSREIAFTNKQ